MYTIKKEFEISCSHRLNNNNLSEDENLELFGKCNNLPNHGHNYKIIIYLKAKILYQKTGMIINFNKLKDVFNKLIDNRFDHKFLNDDILFKNTIPTVENMCKIFFDILKPAFKELHKIEIYETSNASAAYEIEGDW